MINHTRSIRPGNLVRLGIVSGLAMLLAAPSLAQNAEPQQDRSERRLERQDRSDRGSGMRGRGSGNRGNWRSGGFAGGWGSVMRPEFSARDARFFQEQLSLDVGQSAIVETLILEYESAFEEAAAGMRDTFEGMRSEDPEREERRAQQREIIEQFRAVREKLQAMRDELPEGEDLDLDVIEKMRAAMEPLRDQLRELRPPRPEGEELQAMIENMSSLADDWRSKRNNLRDQFLGDVQVTLNPHQLENWSAFDRSLRRFKSMERAELSGENADLFLIIREMQIDQHHAENIAPSLDAYAIALDGALKTRNENLETSRMDIMRNVASGEIDVALDLQRRQTATRIAVRDVNDRYAQQLHAAIADSMSPEIADDFTQRFQMRAYPRVYSPSPAQQSFRTALQLDDLDQETREAINAIQGDFLNSLSSVNQDMLRVVRDVEPKQSELRLNAMAARMNGKDFDWRANNPFEAIRDADESRDTLNQSYREQLEALLTPEQIGELPSMEQQRRRGRDRGRFDDGDRRRDDRRDAERRERMLKQFDADGDGELSEAERDTMQQERRRGRDRNRDSA